MESLCFCNPFFQHVRWVLHGQNHGGNLSVKSHGELSNSGEFILELGFGGKVFEFVDEFLESVVWSAILVLSWFLNEFGQISPCSYFGIKGVKILIVVLDKLCEGLVFRFDCHIP